MPITFFAVKSIPTKGITKLMGKKLLWFAALWAMGVLTVAAVAYSIRAVLL